jgi:hypothetical protein
LQKPIGGLLPLAGKHAKNMMFLLYRGYTAHSISANRILW